jgi:hypothetical protein
MVKKLNMKNFQEIFKEIQDLETKFHKTFGWSKDNQLLFEGLYKKLNEST